MNTKILSGAASEKPLAAKLEELLRGVDWLRGWKVKRVGGESAPGFDLLATVPLPGGGEAALCVECRIASGGGGGDHRFPHRRTPRLQGAFR